MCYLACNKVTYQEYVERGGSASEEAFNESAAPAEAYVKYLIGFNPIDTCEKREAYVRAVCVAVNAYAEYGNGTAQGFTIGSFSMREGGSSGECTAETVAKKGVEGELLKAGLLWGGIA